MASIEKALQIAGRAHEGQKDKDGQPYILHPLRVMNAVARLLPFFGVFRR
jgi:GTP diphosphokinase / guanosine-3',5'-bis(diphosphate) 3'-diphosphatase